MILTSSYVWLSDLLYIRNYTVYQFKKERSHDKSGTGVIAHNACIRECRHSSPFLLGVLVDLAALQSLVPQVLQDYPIRHDIIMLC